MAASCETVASTSKCAAHSDDQSSSHWLLSVSNLRRVNIELLSIFCDARPSSSDEKAAAANLNRGRPAGWPLEPQPGLRSFTLNKNPCTF
jgi:hypothetical protein